jgi:hypothetical protein
MVGVTAESTLAFSLWRQGRGWSWRVCDLEGEVVATGAAETQEEAEEAITAVYRNAASQESAAA